VRLHAFDSPLVSPGKPVTPADLLFACQVCAEEALGDVSLMDKLRIFRMGKNPEHFKKMLNAFAGYILVEDWPKFWEQNAKKGSPGNKGIPWPLAIISNLIACGIDEKRAWEMPECQAIWLNSALAIRKGADVAIMSPEEEAFIASEEAKEAASNPAKESNVSRSNS
jgi:hypothetical protein